MNDHSSGKQRALNLGLRADLNPACARCPLMSALQHIVHMQSIHLRCFASYGVHVLQCDDLYYYLLEISQAAWIRQILKPFPSESCRKRRCFHWFLLHQSNSSETTDLFAGRRSEKRPSDLKVPSYIYHCSAICGCFPISSERFSVF